MGHIGIILFFLILLAIARRSYHGRRAPFGLVVNRLINMWFGLILMVYVGLPIVLYFTLTLIR
jgi:hypothetical protein